MSDKTRIRGADAQQRERRDVGETGIDGGFAIRARTQIELRSVEGAKMPGLRGYTAVFNSWSEPLGFFEDFRERIAPGAFAKTIQESDIRALFNHEPNMIFGRNKSGTLRLAEDSKGLEFEVDELPDTTVGRDLAANIERGDVSGCSFGFRTVGDEWTSVKPADAPDDEGVVEWRTLLELRLFDVGPVVYPAYPETTTEVRSKVAGLRAARDAGSNGELWLRSYNHRLREIEANGGVVL